MTDQARKPKQGSFAQLPWAILERTDIGLTAKVVLTVLLDAKRRKKEPFRSGQYIAELIRVSPNTVSRCLAELERAKMLQLDRRGLGNFTTYTIPEWVTKMVSQSSPPSGVGHQNGEPGSPKCVAMGHQNGEPNRIRVKKKRIEDSCAGPQKKQTRKRDVIWDAVVSEWFPSGVPTSNRSRVGKVVRDLKELKATPKDLAVRIRRYKAGWPEAVCSPEAIVKHWDQFLEDVSKRDKKPSRVHARPGKYDGLKIHRSG
jgi:hypothetical protein